ncbi:MAG: flagellar biosynthetic protein FliO, partial [Gemmatimonadaceae bacterium]
MLLQSMGIMAALLFVLGLIGVTVWVAKRFGGATVNPRTRLPVEIVQRIPLGPKSGLAVVRVGEKVMAVSIGPDGIRPMFELDEADRLRVIATSQIVTPFATSADAGKALMKSLPAVVSRLFDRDALGALKTAKAAALLAAADSSSNELLQYESFNRLSTNAVPQVESFSRYAPPSSPAPSKADREFGDMLNIAMSGATRLAVFAGIIVLSSAGLSSKAHAQVSPPVVAPPTVAPEKPAQPVTPVATPPSATPKTSDSLSTLKLGAPASFVLPKNFERPRTAPIRTATPKPAGVGTFPAKSAQTDSTKSKAAPTVTTNKAGAPTIIPNTRSGNKANTALPAPIASADDALAKLIPQMDLKLGDGKDGGLRMSGTVGIVVMMGLLTLIPTLLLMMTGFTRILIVLHFLKQAMGTQAAPPAQLLAAMALLLTGFVMAPTLTEMNRSAIEPWMDGKITQIQMMETGVKPLRVFMEKQTRESDLKTFIGLSHLPRPNTIDDVPLHVLTSAFVASELRRSFQIGFIIYLPFIVIDAVVASVLMSMGMFMLPPAMISMPFK